MKYAIMVFLSLIIAVYVASVGQTFLSGLVDVIAESNAVEVAEIQAKSAADVAAIEWSHKERIAQIRSDTTKHTNVARTVEALGSRAIVLAAVAFLALVACAWSVVGGHGSMKVRV